MKQIYNLYTIDRSGDEIPKNHYVKLNIPEEQTKKLIEKYRDDNPIMVFEDFMGFLKQNSISAEVVDIIELLFNEYDSS